jgi:hypothetical protein
MQVQREITRYQDFRPRIERIIQSKMAPKWKAQHPISGRGLHHNPIVSIIDRSTVTNDLPAQVKFGRRGRGRNGGQSGSKGESSQVQRRRLTFEVTHGRRCFLRRQGARHIAVCKSA